MHPFPCIILCFEFALSCVSLFISGLVSLFKMSISTGSNNLDALLGGGIRRGQITELFGEASAGKSNICHSVAVQCQLPRNGGGSTLYIDTEGRFRSSRILAMAERAGVVDALAKIFVARAYGVEQLVGLLFKAETTYLTQGNGVSVLVVDCPMFLYRTEFDTGTELYARQSHLASFLRICRNLATRYNLAVLLTNQIYTDINAGPGVDNSRPLGGNIMERDCDHRIRLSRGIFRTEERIATVYSSSLLPAGHSTRFIIDGFGIRD